MSDIQKFDFEKVCREGIPKDTAYIVIPETGFWLEFKRWKNDTYRICLCDPMKGTKRLVWLCASFNACSWLLYMVLAPK